MYPPIRARGRPPARPASAVPRSQGHDYFEESSDCFIETSRYSMARIHIVWSLKQGGFSSGRVIFLLLSRDSRVVAMSSRRHSEKMVTRQFGYGDWVSCIVVVWAKKLHKVPRFTALIKYATRMRAHLSNFLLFLLGLIAAYEGRLGPVSVLHATASISLYALNAHVFRW